MVANLDLGAEYVGGINKPTPDKIGYYARVDPTGYNLEYVPSGGGGGGGSGDVVGPAGATAGNLAVFSGTTGKLIADGGSTIATLIALIPGPGASVQTITQTTGTAGSASTVSRSDHRHGISTAAPGAVSLAGVSAAEGVATSLARSDHTHSITGRVPFANLPSTATDTLFGRDAAGAGDAQSIGVTGGVEFDGSNNIQVSTTLPARGTENVAVDLIPPTQAQGTLATATTLNTDIAIATGKRYQITADVYVDDGSGTGACIYAKSILVRAHQTGGAAVIVTSNIIDDTATAGWAFTAAANSTNVRFALVNTSGTTRSYTLLIGKIVADKP